MRKKESREKEGNKFDEKIRNRYRTTSILNNPGSGVTHATTPNIPQKSIILYEYKV